MRKPGALLMLACAIAQLSLGGSFLASLLELGVFAGHPHAHSVILKSDGNHLDVVLSHGEGRGLEHGDSPQQHVHHPGLYEGDHVVHVTVASALNTSSRRATLDTAPTLTSSIALAFVASPAGAPTRSSEPRVRGVDHLRTVVLRL